MCLAVVKSISNIMNLRIFEVILLQKMKYYRF